MTNSSINLSVATHFKCVGLCREHCIKYLWVCRSQLLDSKVKQARILLHHDTSTRILIVCVSDVCIPATGLALMTFFHMWTGRVCARHGTVNAIISPLDECRAWSHIYMCVYGLCIYWEYERESIHMLGYIFLNDRITKQHKKHREQHNNKKTLPKPRAIHRKTIICIVWCIICRVQVPIHKHTHTEMCVWR